ncbi:hypothetical protein MOQ72_32405 [Saccharopolyspora sp. K220]|uniref:hypothetical protein n=1 Tax=Saccharopolyspora soli TaxID=2926618 RepID=UPI001F59CC98|nr:hypothetical protein [Saccharopolyspora soli]MCI2422143.1 hypothetical protein [Saccharopolyspora soli]
MNRTLLSDRLHEVLADVRRLRQRFATTAFQEWDPSTAAAELSVQVGHLALCLLRQHGADVSAWEDPQRSITNVGDELADVVLAALSINVLAHSEPAEATGHPQARNEVEAFLRLLVAAGSLSEAALVEHHYRHRPEGRPPSLPEASAAVIAACDVLADQLGLDLIGEFRSMVADADSFLDQRGGAS